MNSDINFAFRPEDSEKVVELMNTLSEKDLGVFRRNMKKIGFKLPPVKPRLSFPDWVHFIATAGFAVLLGITLYCALSPPPAGPAEIGDVRVFGIHPTIWFRFLIISPYMLWCTYKSIKKLLEIKKYKSEVKGNAY